ncbi:Hypothetical protein ETEE_0925 [Edwardsiella anguillarum ET080813]|uniref:Uncharacterized protein n=1 Tax=Edwardsiella anguillarum ET080813 TaxID=667120 RepID=A0A076LKT6_9GAMM|nr:Hypothetical protein ETEE_0925 [Edwardsiella anguillarum ET080813]
MAVYVHRRGRAYPAMLRRERKRYHVMARGANVDCVFRDGMLERRAARYMGWRELNLRPTLLRGKSHRP